MNDPGINDFVKKIMTIDTDYPGMGGASSAIIGGSSTNEDIANDLRRNVISFAAEYSNPTSDKNVLVESSQQLKGSFMALRMMNFISDSKLEELLSEVEAFLDSRVQ